MFPGWGADWLPAYSTCRPWAAAPLLHKPHHSEGPLMKLGTDKQSLSTCMTRQIWKCLVPQCTEVRVVSGSSLINTQGENSGCSNYLTNTFGASKESMSTRISVIWLVYYIYVFKKPSIRFFAESHSAMGCHQRQDTRAGRLDCSPRLQETELS